MMIIISSLKLLDKTESISLETVLVGDFTFYMLNGIIPMFLNYPPRVLQTDGLKNLKSLLQGLNYWIMVMVK